MFVENLVRPVVAETSVVEAQPPPSLDSLQDRFRNKGISVQVAPALPGSPPGPLLSPWLAPEAAEHPPPPRSQGTPPLPDNWGGWNTGILEEDDNVTQERILNDGW